MIILNYFPIRISRFRVIIVNNKFERNNFQFMFRQGDVFNSQSWSQSTKSYCFVEKRRIIREGETVKWCGICGDPAIRDS